VTETHIIDLLRLPLIGVVLYVGLAQLWQYSQNRNDRVYLWVAAWGFLAAAMLLSRVIQHTLPDPEPAQWPTRVLIAAGLAMAPVAVSGAHAFLMRPPSMFVLALQVTGVLVVAASAFTDWLFYWDATVRTDALGRSYYAASFGPLAPIVMLYAVAAGGYCIAVIRQARELIDETGRFLALLPVLVLLALSLNDVLMLGEVITSVHASDLGTAAVGIAFSYAHARRSREYLVGLERDGALREKLVESVIEAQETERERIARDLHESTGQTLTSLAMHLRAVEQANDLESLRQQVAEVRTLTKGALEQVRSVARELHPATLDDFGFVAGLNQHVDELRAAHDIDIDILLSGFDAYGRLPTGIELALYRIAQEALRNTVRLAAATTVSVVVDRTATQVRMIIEDDGCGFDVATASGLGLLSMRERATACGGDVTIESSPGSGTGVFVAIPIRKRADSSRSAI
jgi:signal transduction histidine kinase